MYASPRGSRLAALRSACDATVREYEKLDVILDSSPALMELCSAIESTLRYGMKGSTAPAIGARVAYILVQRSEALSLVKKVNLYGSASERSLSTLTDYWHYVQVLKKEHPHAKSAFVSIANMSNVGSVSLEPGSGLTSVSLGGYSARPRAGVDSKCSYGRSSRGVHHQSGEQHCSHEGVVSPRGYFASS